MGCGKHTLNHSRPQENGAEDKGKRGPLPAPANRRTIATFPTGPGMPGRAEERAVALRPHRLDDLGGCEKGKLRADSPSRAKHGKQQERLSSPDRVGTRPPRYCALASSLWMRRHHTFLTIRPRLLKSYSSPRFCGEAGRGLVVAYKPFSKQRTPPSPASAHPKPGPAQRVRE
jgi:hypothetical protein